MTTVDTRVGSYNLYQRSNDDHANRSLRQFVKHVDVAGLQEYGGPIRRQSLEQLADLGFSYFKPRAVPTAPPIIWRADRFQLRHGDAPRVAAGRRVAKVPGKRAVLEDLHAGMVTLLDLVLDEDITLWNLHTPAHVEFWPGARREMYRDSFRELGGDYVVGDFNWSLTKPTSLPRLLLAEKGLISCWAGYEPNAPTEGRRVIDGVFARQRATSAHVHTEIRCGDHKPVVAAYRSKEHR